jgi:hypothetical protein
MQNATATAIKPQLQNVSTNGDVHTTEEPGTVLDSHGESVTSKKDFIAMTDEGLAKKPISVGLAAIISIVLAILSVWVYSMTTAMGYQTVVSHVDTIDRRVEKLEKAFDDIQSLKMSAQKTDSTLQTLRETQTAGEADRKQIMKDIADIRIMMAQKAMHEPSGGG